MTRRRCGRPRKDPFHSRSSAGYGPTPEQERRRLILTGPGAPAAWAEYPLGVLRARGWLTERQHDAGCRYAWLFRVAIGGERLAASNLTGRSFTGPEQRSEAWIAARTRDYGRARDLLQGLASQTRHLVEDVSIYQRLPSFCLERRYLRGRERRMLARLQLGLDHLAAEFEAELRPAA